MHTRDGHWPAALILTAALLGIASSAGADDTAGHVPASPAVTLIPGLLDLLERLGVVTAATEGGDGFLKPDEAFVLSTEVLDSATVVARWDLAESYYLYRDKFSFAVVAPGTVGLGRPLLPDGKIKQDPYFGTTEVYYYAVEATLPLQRQATGETNVTLEIRYQGCTERGLCYPPTTKRVSVVLPAAR